MIVFSLAVLDKLKMWPEDTVKVKESPKLLFILVGTWMFGIHPTMK